MIRVSIQCNKCGCDTESRKNDRSAIIKLRHRASLNGWTHKAHSAIDLCPRCSREAEPDPTDEEQAATDEGTS